MHHALSRWPWEKTGRKIFSLSRSSHPSRSKCFDRDRDPISKERQSISTAPKRLCPSKRAQATVYTITTYWQLLNARINIQQISCFFPRLQFLWKVVRYPSRRIGGICGLLRYQPRVGMQNVRLYGNIVRHSNFDALQGKQSEFFGYKGMSISLPLVLTANAPQYADGGSQRRGTGFVCCCSRSFLGPYLFLEELFVCSTCKRKRVHILLDFKLLIAEYRCKRQLTL